MDFLIWIAIIILAVKGFLFTLHFGLVIALAILIFGSPILPIIGLFTLFF